MNQYQYTENGRTFRRVSKKEAKKAYENGEAIVCCPVNLRPEKPYNPEVVICAKDCLMEFEAAVNQFEYYNCINAETGKYAAFYIQVAKLNYFYRGENRGFSVQM